MFFTLVVIIAVIVVEFLIKGLSEKDEVAKREEEREISFSQHAVQRMDERGIETDRVIRVLEEGIRVQIANYNRLKVSDDEMTVILEKRLNNFEVMTVYWNDDDHEDTDFIP